MEICNDCNSNPSLNDGSLGIEWIRGGVVKSYACGCSIQGRGFCNYPLHIHFCENHQANEMLVANVLLLLKYFDSSPDERDRMERHASVATGGNMGALEAIVEKLRLYVREPVQGHTESRTPQHRGGDALES